MNWFKNHKAEIFVGSGALVAGVLSFFITLSVYPNLKNKSTYINKQGANEQSKLVANNTSTNTNEIDIVLQDNFNDIKNNIDDSSLIVETEILEKVDDNEIEKIDIKNENLEDNENNLVEKNKMLNNIISDNMNIDEIEVVEAIAMDNNTSSNNIKFSMPVSGDIITEFANDKLVFSETLSEWIIHNGIDILGEVASPVKVAMDGVVESIKMDPRYGNTIIVKHQNGYKTIYSNLSTLDLVYVGQNLNREDIISGVGEGFGFESKDAPHLHFEIMKDDDYLNPLEYLKQ